MWEKDNLHDKIVYQKARQETRDKILTESKSYTKQINDFISDVNKIGFKDGINKWLNKGEFDKIAKHCWPPRCKGDMTIRRTRFYDLFKTQGELAIEWCERMIGSSYVWVLITGWYACGMDNDWRNVMSRISIYPMGVWDTVTGAISNYVKSNDMEEGWQLYAEMKCLTGYRLLPWPGFDDEKQTKGLAEGGNEHDMYLTFDEWTKIALKEGLSRPTTYATFEEYVASGDWITQGASSEGRIEVEYQGKVYNVKCRKNMVPDALTIEQLVKMSLNKKTQTSSAFAKCELGKVRIAVCSDLETYLKMNWIVTISGRGYKEWRHVTRNETSRTKLKRMKYMVDRCKKGLFGMAWDYEGFERQVKTIELVIIYCRIVEAARFNVPNGSLTEFDKIVKEVEISFWHSYIKSMNGREIPVEGGLPSGLYLTSIVGDGFNLTACTAVAEILKQLGVPRLRKRIQKYKVTIRHSWIEM